MADIGDGTLHFKATLDSDELAKQVDIAVRCIQGMSSAIVGTGDAMDEVTAEVVECIEIQKKVIQELEATVESLDNKMQELEPGDAQVIIGEQAKEAQKELLAEKEALVTLEKELQNVSDTSSQTTGEILENINKQKNVVKSLEDSLVKLGEYQQSSHPDAQLFIENQIISINKRLKEEREELAMLDEQLKTLQLTSTNFAVAAGSIESAFQQIDFMLDENKVSLKALEAEYERLGEISSEIFTSGKGNLDEYYRIEDTRKALSGEIEVRKKVISEIQEQGQALSDHERKLDAEKKKVEENANAHVSFRTQLKNVREELLLMEQAGKRNTDEYRALEQEAGRLAGALSNVNKQTQILGHNQSGFQGVLSGITGITGAFSAATGALSMFAGKNEDLQQIMVKVQSLMAITIGLQQVQQMLHEKSAFSLIVLTKAKSMFSAATLMAGTSLIRFGVSAGVARVAAIALMATLTLGLSVAITAAVVAITRYISKSQQAAKESKEFAEKVVEYCYKQIGAFKLLQSEWNELNGDIQKQKKFLLEYSDQLKSTTGKTMDLVEVDELFSKNANKFVESLIIRANALAAYEQAQGKIKEVAKKEMEAASMNDYNTAQIGGAVYGTAGTSVVGGRTVQIENLKKKNLKAEIEKDKEAIAELFKTQVDLSDQEKAILEKIGLSNEKIVDGSITALEKSISNLKARYKEAANDSERKKLLLDIKEQEALLSKIDLSGTKESKKDPFVERLEKQKQEYQRFMKWINSGDATIARVANEEFSGLLKQGATYIDYLKRQREEIESVDISERTKSQNSQLRILNNQIAEETKKTVLESFNNELATQLSNANSIVEMLNIIEKRRKELANDGTELDNSKKDTLDNAEKDVAKQAKEETDALIENYSSYLAQKVKLEEQFTNDMMLLQKKRSEATTDSERTEIDRVISNRKKQYQNDSKGSGDIEYDALLKEYADFEQKKQSIVDKYSEKRSVVMQREKDLHIELNNAKTDNERAEIEKRIEENKKLQTVLNLKESKDIEKITVDDLMDSESWNQLFGNLDKLTASEMIKLRNKIESDWEKLDLSPEQLNALRDKINEVTDKIEKKNPFLALADAIERYKKGEKGVDFKDVMKSTAASLDLIGGAFDAVVGGLKDMGVAMDEETEEILNNISNIIDGASKIAEGIATNNPLSIIQGSIGLLTSAVDLFDSKSRRAQREIRKHQAALKKLEFAYSDLERAANKALGEDRYSSQKDSIENLKKQNAELAGMIENEDKKKKKKRDQGKIDGWDKAIKDNEYAIEDAINNLREQILGLDAASAAQQLGDAFIEAFKDGENAVEAFGKKADEIVAGIMKKMLIEKLLEKPMGQIFDKYSSQWYDKDANFAGYDKVMKDAGMMGGEMKGLASGFAQAMENLPDEIKKYFLGDTPEDIDTSLTGAIKGVSEETASMVGGQMNAMRINQMEATAILRQQLMHLATIAHNTSYNKHLESIDNKLDNLNKGDSLRSQGLS